MRYLVYAIEGDYQIPLDETNQKARASERAQWWLSLYPRTFIWDYRTMSQKEFTR